GQYRPRRDVEVGVEAGCRIDRNRAPVTQHASHHRTQLTSFLTRRAALVLRAESLDAFASPDATSAHAAPGERDRRSPASAGRTSRFACGREQPGLDPRRHPGMAAGELWARVVGTRRGVARPRRGPAVADGPATA